ncbi:MAG TPA: protein kinase [Candidatus Eisenbacteria bacterium]|nr:protein kinase [Candidatus Eisenbacteria bacterium]
MALSRDVERRVHRTRPVVVTDRERSDRAAELFGDALEHDPADRPAFLDRSCGDDAALRREVESLLEALPVARKVFESGPPLEALEVRDERPERLGPYRPLREIGRGGMGVVYLARDDRLERDVAIKALPDVDRLDRQRLDRFLREARVLAAINHPNISTLYDLHEEPDGRRFLVLEHLRGETLAVALKKGPIEIDRALALCAQIVDALEAAHARSIAHLDLKPGNVMVDDRGRIKVLDFGLARSWDTIPAQATDGTAMPEITADVPAHPGPAEATTMRLGTPSYMPPEQLEGARPSPSWDLFSFGCLLYECLAGRRAFPGHSLAEVFQAILRSEPDWSALPHDTPPELRELLVSCLEKNPARRIPDIHTLRARLDQVRAARRRDPSRLHLATPSHNLPTRITSFVGRAADLAECRRLLRRASLLTVTGLGGSGKSRLMLELARESVDGFADGAWWVDLAPISDPRRIGEVAARMLGLRERANQSPADVLVEHLREHACLLLLDNCEHVRAACAELAARVVKSGGRSRIVATSREALGTQGEVAYSLTPLALPDDGGTAEGAEAVQLFVDRATLARSEFELSADNTAAVVSICRRLDGLPLAIELAAAQLASMPVEDVERRLSDRFQLLQGKRIAAARHLSLEAALESSYEMLAEGDQSRLGALAIFAGTWTVASAAAVWKVEDQEALNALMRLVRKSLVMVDTSGRSETRYNFLETVRHYAADRLADSGGLETARDRHFDYFAQLARDAEPNLVGPQSEAWLGRLDRDHENFLAAIDRCDATPEGATRALALSVALSGYWYLRGLLTLSRTRLLRALERAQGPSTRAHAAAMRAAGGIATEQGDYAAGLRLCEASLAIFREVGDVDGEIRAVDGMGAAARWMGRFDEAVTHYETALDLCRRHGRRKREALILNNLADLHTIRGDEAAARRACEAGLALAREQGNWQTTVHALLNLALIDVRGGDHTAAAGRLREVFQARHEAPPAMWMTYIFEVMAEVAVADDAPWAARCWGFALEQRSKTGVLPSALEREERARVEARLAAVLGEAHRDALIAEGRSMSRDEAMTKAIAWIEARPR